MNLPSFETQGIVPCWKKVTCSYDIYLLVLVKTISEPSGLGQVNQREA